TSSLHQLLDSPLRAFSDGFEHGGVSGEPAERIDRFFRLYLHNEVDERDLHEWEFLLAQRLEDALAHGLACADFLEGINASKSYVDVRIVHKSVEECRQDFTIGIVKLIAPADAL